MSTPFAGKVILVTGAGSGIGRATSIRLSELGASLALSDINLTTTTETATLCSSNLLPNQKHTAHSVDVSDNTAVTAFVDSILSTHGHIDHVFNCAGVNPTPMEVLATTPEYADRLIRVNLQGTINVCRAALAHLRAGSAVVNVSSIAGVRPRAGMAVYAATKAGVIGFSKAMALEYGGRGIRTNVVAPGDIATATNAAVCGGEETVKRARESVALGRMGEPGEVADVVVFLMQGGFVNGAVIDVNGGVE